MQSRRGSRDGHTESVSLKFKNRAEAAEILKAWAEFRSVPQEKHLPSAPEVPIQYLDLIDRPQPRLDVDSGHGMTTSVGRLRPCGVLDWKFTVLSHNTIRGAAGAALLNAETAESSGIPGVISLLLFCTVDAPSFAVFCDLMSIVMKFGGTSVGDAKAIERVAEIVRERLPQRPVVVVSAMARVTDQFAQDGAFSRCGRTARLHSP